MNPDLERLRGDIRRLLGMVRLRLWSRGLLDRYARWL